MIEIKPCKHCGSYPNIAVNSITGLIIMYCPICIEGTLLRTELYAKEKYNVALFGLFESWNAKGGVNMNEKLKPCPFCGKTETIRLVYDNDNMHKIMYSQIVCDVNLGGCGGSSGFSVTEEKTITAWNTRADTQEADNGK